MQEDTKQIIIYFILIFLFLVVLSIAIPNTQIGFDANESEESGRSDFVGEPVFFKSQEGIIVSLKVPAINLEGEGVPVLLKVEAVKGTGRTLMDIESLLFWADTQHSIRLARLIAGNVSGKNLDNYDLIYSVETEATAIGGPSAGAAIDLATIFALNEEEPRQDVMITGTINHDGTIGPVEDILAKAHATRKFNATTLLVPLLQSKDVQYEHT
jgi:uncharacterized protein